MTDSLSASVRELDNIADDWMTLRPSSTVDAIVELLQDAIVRGELPQGMRLRQELFAKKFAISKIPLREALAKLDAAGFVTTHPRRGVFVSEISAERIEEIFQLRLSIEPDLLRYAVPRMTTADMAKVEKIIETFEVTETAKLGQVNWELHRALYVPSGRDLSLQILGNLHLHVDRYVRLHMGILDPTKSSNDEHRAILAACRERDIDLAVQILREHIDNIRLAIGRFVNPSPAASLERPS